METGDRPSRDGDGVDELEHKTGERPSEEAIRNRLIDRRRTFDEAEEGRRLANRFRQQMRARGSSASLSRRAMAPARAVSRALEALQNRPIIAFAAAASLSAAILVPLALSSYAPLPGEMPLPAATTPTHSTTTVQGEQSPPSVRASFSPEPAHQPTEMADRRAPIARAAPDGSMFETLESEEAAAAAKPFDGPAGKNAASSEGQDVADDPALLETASLREVGPALPGRASDGTGGSAAPEGQRSIDPAAAALALRLPNETSDALSTLPTILDPATTGSISPDAAADGASEDPTAAAPNAVMPGTETAGPAKSFIAISPSILIATSDEEGSRSMGASAAGVAGDAKTSDPAASSAEVSPANGHATASVNLRAEPTNDGKIVAVLAKDEAVTVVACEAWCEVETASGSKGFVYEKFIARGTEG